MLAIYVNF